MLNKKERKFYDSLFKVDTSQFSGLESAETLYANQTQNDPVNKPNHYIGDKGIEMREVQENFAPRYAKYGGLAVSDVKDIFKYIGRAPLKNGVQDLHKAKRHLEWLIERVEDDENEHTN